MRISRADHTIPLYGSTKMTVFYNNICHIIELQQNCGKKRLMFVFTFIKEQGSLSLLLCPPGKRPSFSFLSLKNWTRKSKRWFVSFAKAIQKQTWLTSWFNSLPRCYIHVQENSSTSGLKTSGPARSANSKALFWVLNETKRLWWQGSPFLKTMVWLRAK